MFARLITLAITFCCATAAAGQVSQAQLRSILDLLQQKEYLSPQTEEYRDVLAELIARSGSPLALNVNNGLCDNAIVPNSLLNLHPGARTSPTLHGDCIGVMREFRPASIDFALTDPRYLVNYSLNDGRTVPNDNNDAWPNPAFAEIYRVLRWNHFCVTFYAWNRADTFIAVTCWHLLGSGKTHRRRIFEVW